MRVVLVKQLKRIAILTEMMKYSILRPLWPSIRLNSAKLSQNLAIVLMSANADLLMERTNWLERTTIAVPRIASAMVSGKMVSVPMG